MKSTLAVNCGNQIYVFDDLECKFDTSKNEMYNAMKSAKEEDSMRFCKMLSFFYDFTKKGQNLKFANGVYSSQKGRMIMEELFVTSMDFGDLEYSSDPTIDINAVWRYGKHDYKIW